MKYKYTIKYKKDNGELVLINEGICIFKNEAKYFFNRSKLILNKYMKENGIFFRKNRLFIKYKTIYE